MDKLKLLNKVLGLKELLKSGRVIYEKDTKFQGMHFGIREFNFNEWVQKPSKLLDKLEFI